MRRVNVRKLHVDECIHHGLGLLCTRGQLGHQLLADCDPKGTKAVKVSRRREHVPRHDAAKFFVGEVDALQRRLAQRTHLPPRERVERRLCNEQRRRGAGRVVQCRLDRRLGEPGERRQRCQVGAVHVDKDVGEASAGRQLGCRRRVSASTFHLNIVTVAEQRFAEPVGDPRNGVENQHVARRLVVGDRRPKRGTFALSIVEHRVDPVPQGGEEGMNVRQEQLVHGLREVAHARLVSKAAVRRRPLEKGLLVG
mmetsp:Transcript_13142/g.41424  ORF Transcript_13142/g.41424 Transcript_13142/m.41424 type:complete len:253 (-) Transcript_13142:935-1693(-)